LCQEAACGLSSRRLFLYGLSSRGLQSEGDGVRYTCFLDMIAFGAVSHCCALLRTVVKLRGVSRNILCVGHVPGHVLA
jgi:hypothetical protein